MKRLTAWLLTLGIIVAIVADSADFFFRRPYYEFWDLAANSLAINRAKHFTELYGSYSRWGFHHPGPVFFYVQAFGEWLFYDLLHLTPAPFNAQTLASLCLTTSFFVGSLTIFSRWISASARRWFVPAALAVGAMHFGAVVRIPTYDMLRGSSVFTSTWTAHAWVLPFLCLLTAGASVAAGRGEDLIPLALAVGVLTHAHIASPLFVGPMTLLAYAGLLAAHLPRDPVAQAVGEARTLTLLRRLPWLAGSAWRAFPGTHIVAGAILALFALPLVIDLFLGDASNFHAVLTHMRTHHGEHKSFMRSLFYFVQFGAYRPYRKHYWEFTRFNAQGAYAYLWYHKKIYAAWIVGALLVSWCSAFRPALIRMGRWCDTAPSTHPATPSRERFLAWAGAFLLLSIVLTLYWGIIQDGGMYYYSGWINFAIYYFGLLIILAEFSSVLAAWVPRWRDGALHTSLVWWWIEHLLPAGVVVLACVAEAGRFRVCDPTPEVNRLMHESFVRVVRDANARHPMGIKMLKFPFLAWPTVAGLALEMEREGQSVMVATVMPVAFPEEMNVRPGTAKETETMEVWHFTLGKSFKVWFSGVPNWFAPRGELLKRELAATRETKPADDAPMFYPLLDDVDLRIDLPMVDPNVGDGATLDLRKHDTVDEKEQYKIYKRPLYAVLVAELGSNPGCALYGFSEPETWGTWNDGAAGALRLRGDLVNEADKVEITLDAHPFLAPLAGVTSQRMNVAVNGTCLGAEKLLQHDEQVVYTVPGLLWNRTFGRTAGAALEFGFPSVRSPAETDPYGPADPRLLGVGFRGIHFHTVESEHPQPALDLEGSDHPAKLDFKAGGNALTFQSEGWWEAEPWGTWSRGHTSTLHFHAGLVEGTQDVEITLNIHSVMDTDSGIKGQRIHASLGGYPIDRERTILSAGKLVLTVPSTIWNSAVADDADAELQLDLPDAVSPARIDPDGKEQDQRQLGIGVEQISFRKLSTPALTSR